jgi:hypothetical protein
MLNIGLLVGSFTMTSNITVLNIGLLVGSFTMTGNITMLNIGLLVGSFYNDRVILPVIVKEPTRRPISTL